MTPIEISKSVKYMDLEMLRNRLNYLSYQFCVNVDFTRVEAVNDLVSRLEMCVVESLMRVFEIEFGYRPFQNKIYEMTEKIFGEQDSYNINRMMSSLRRVKVIPIDPTNEKYVHWMKNRIRYGVKSICEYMEEEVQAEAAQYT